MGRSCEAAMRMVGGVTVVAVGTGMAMAADDWGDKGLLAATVGVIGLVAFAVGACVTVSGAWKGLVFVFVGDAAPTGQG